MAYDTGLPVAPAVYVDGTVRDADWAVYRRGWQDG
jgi:hypothetical protein